MAAKYSTGVATGLLDSLDTMFTNCVIDIYAGNRPNAPDDAVSNIMLGRVTLAGGAFVEGVAANGLNFAAATLGIMAKEPLEEWKFTGLADGTARWFRLRANAVDDGTLSTTLLRIDGDVGSVSGDMVLSNINITTGAPNTVDTFNIAPRQV